MIESVRQIDFFLGNFFNCRISFKPMQEIKVQDGFLQSTKIIYLVHFSFVFYTLLNYWKSVRQINYYKTGPMPLKVFNNCYCYTNKGENRLKIFLKQSKISV